MTQLIRNAARELRYRRLTDIIGGEIPISSLDSVAGDVLPHLAKTSPWPIRFKGPERESLMIMVVKYGHLDLTFEVDGVSWTEEDAPGLTLLKDLGFLPERDPHQARGFLKSDPGCVELLYEDIERHETLLRLFLEGPDPNHMKNLFASGRGKALFEGDETFENCVKDYFPGKFTVADACLTNADCVWFHEHFYL